MFLGCQTSFYRLGGYSEWTVDTMSRGFLLRWKLKPRPLRPWTVLFFSLWKPQSGDFLWFPLWSQFGWSLFVHIKKVEQWLCGKVNSFAFMSIFTDLWPKWRGSLNFWRHQQPSWHCKGLVWGTPVIIRFILKRKEDIFTSLQSRHGHLISFYFTTNIKSTFKRTCFIYENLCHKIRFTMSQFDAGTEILK